MSDLLHRHLQGFLLNRFQQHRVVLWEDPSGALEPLLRETLPHDVTMPRFEGNLLSLRQQIDSQDPWLERKWLLYVPVLPEGVETEWLADYAQGFSRLPQADFGWALNHFYGLSLSAELRRLLRGRAALRLATELHRFVGDGVDRLREDDVLSAVLRAALNAPEANDGELVVRYLVGEGSETFSELLPSLTTLVKKRLGLKRNLVEGQPPDRPALARCLLASALVECGAAPAGLVGNYLPEPSARPRWRKALDDGLRDAAVRDRLAEAIHEHLHGAAFWDSLDDAGALVPAPALEIVDEHMLRVLLRRQPADEIRSGDWWSSIADVAKQRSARPDLSERVRSWWTAVGAAASLLQRAHTRLCELTSYPLACFERLATEYAAPNGDWQIDALYRACAQVPPGLAQEAVDALLRPARDAYHRFTREQTRRCVGAAAAEGPSLPAAFPQRRFWSEMVDRPVESAVLIVDALRADVAFELAERMRRKGKTVESRMALAELPTRTEVGMAALLPRAHEGFAVTVEGGRLTAFIGDTRVAGTVERARFEAKAPLPRPVLRRHLNDWLADGGALLASARREKQLPLAHTTDLDEGGEIAATVDFQLFDKIVASCERFASMALDAGFTEVVVAGDHGFLVRDPDAVTLAVPGTDASGGRLARGLRYAAGAGNVSSELVRFTAATLGRKGDNVFVPADTACLAIPGGAGLFVHGGLSLQESVLVFLRVAGDQAAPEREAVSVQLDVPERVTSLAFKATVQPGKVKHPLLTAERAVVVSLEDAEGRPIGGQQRELVVRPGGTEQSVLLTTPAAGTYRVTVSDVGKTVAIAVASVHVEVLGGEFDF